MPLIKNFRPKHPGQAGSLGVVQRSIGYLQGGYKDNVIHSKVQLFNTVTQVGSIVYDTGYARSYRPGITGNFNGYFSISDNTDYNKFSFITASAYSSFSTLSHPMNSVVDAGLFTQAWINIGDNGSLDALRDWYKINLANDTPTNKGAISPYAHATTRQGLSFAEAGLFIRPNTLQALVLNYTTETATLTDAIMSMLSGGYQVGCGMTRDNTYGYFVDYFFTNIRVQMTGPTVMAAVSATPYTYRFGESHSINSHTEGFMMAGYADTTGRYGGTQHGLCQKISFATEAVSTLPDLVLPQSSGQMMQGF